MSTEAAHPRRPLSERSDSAPFSVWYLVEILAAGAGLALSLYLTVQHTRLKLGIQGGPSFCSFGENFDCDAVNSSAFSEVLGIPIALFGALFYLTILVAALLASPKKAGFAGLQRWTARLALVALTVDLVLFVIQLFVLKNVCVVCSSTYLCTVLFLYAATALAPGASFGERFRNLLWQEPAVLPGKGKLAIGAAVVVAISVGALLVPGVLPPKEDASERELVEQWFRKFEAMPKKLLPETPDDGVWGPVGAPHQLVVFSDFQCPHCRRAAKTLEKALEPYRDQVRFVYKNFPLDSSCNPALSFPLHPHACYLATQGVCAARAGKFKAYHDEVFLKLPEDAFAEGREAIDRGLDAVVSAADRRRCNEDVTVQAALRTSIELGRELGVKGTPAFFLDGRFVEVVVSSRTLPRLLGLAGPPKN